MEFGLFPLFCHYKQRYGLHPWTNTLVGLWGYATVSSKNWNCRSKKKCALTLIDIATLLSEGAVPIYPPGSDWNRALACPLPPIPSFATCLNLPPSERWRWHLTVILTGISVIMVEGCISNVKASFLFFCELLISFMNYPIGGQSSSYWFLRVLHIGRKLVLHNFCYVWYHNFPQFTASSVCRHLLSMYCPYRLCLRLTAG